MSNIGTWAYIARTSAKTEHDPHPVGTVVCAAIDRPGHEKVVAKHVARWIEQGLAIERVPVEWAREFLGTTGAVSGDAMTLHLTSCTTPDIAEAHTHRVVAAGELVAELVAALWEARLQIEYLHEKFQETGSGNGVLSQINAALALARASAALARAEGAAP